MEFKESRLLKLSLEMGVPPKGIGKDGVGHSSTERASIQSWQHLFNSVHTRCIVKTGGFTRGVCKNQGVY